MVTRPFASGSSAPPSATSREARGSRSRLCVCSASALMRNTGSPPSKATVTNDPYGYPGGSRAIVQSVPVAIAAASVRARSACVGVATVTSYNGSSASPVGRAWASMVISSSADASRTPILAQNRSASFVLLGVAAARHLEPVEFLFHLMERIVSDRVAGPHGENGSPGSSNGRAMNVAMSTASFSAGFGFDAHRSKVGREFLPDQIRNRRSIAVEARKAGLQGPFACGVHFMADRIVVGQRDRPEERLERQSLEHERAEHDRERRHHNEVAERKGQRQRECCRERDDAAHTGP